MKGHLVFGPLLERHIRRQGRSRISVSLAACVDPSYTTRIVKGERAAPSRHVVEAFARVLNLSDYERGQLLAAAGYFVEWWDELTPPQITRVAAADAPEVHAALGFLNRAAAEVDMRRFAQLVAQARVVLERVVGSEG